MLTPFLTLQEACLLGQEGQETLPAASLVPRWDHPGSLLLPFQHMMPSLTGLSLCFILQASKERR